MLGVPVLRWAFDLEGKKMGLVKNTRFPYKSGVSFVALRTNASRPPFQATQRVAGYMRREETKCKKPLVGAKSSAIQFSPILLSLLEPAARCLTAPTVFLAAGLGPGSWRHLTVLFNQHQLDSPQAGSGAQQGWVPEFENL